MSHFLENLDIPIRNVGVGLNVKFEDVGLDFIKEETSNFEQSFLFPRLLSLERYINLGNLQIHKDLGNLKSCWRNVCGHVRLDSV